MEQEKTNVAYFCPECGSASVEFSGLVGGGASCRVCKWEGAKDKLLAHVFSHEHGDGSQVTQAILNDFRRACAVSAQSFGQILVKWGFITDPSNVKTLSRYIAAICRASLLAVLEERQKIEQERVNGN